MVAREQTRLCLNYYVIQACIKANFVAISDIEWQHLVGVVVRCVRIVIVVSSVHAPDEAVNR